MKLNDIIQGIVDLNINFNFPINLLDREMDEFSKTLFLALGIEDPLPLQVVCINFCTSDIFQGRCVIQLETGCGKTALCYTTASYYAHIGKKGLIINESEELTFRDFKKAQEVS